MVKHYNYFRDYDSGTGRYFQSDPTGLSGGLSTYAYATANGISHFDLDGTTSAVPLPGVRPIPLPRPRPDPVPLYPGKGKDHADYCTELFTRCVQERWGGSWTCAQCQFYCTGINKEWPFWHCSPVLKECRL